MVILDFKDVHNYPDDRIKTKETVVCIESEMAPIEDDVINEVGNYMERHVLDIVVQEMGIVRIEVIIMENGLLIPIGN